MSTVAAVERLAQVADRLARKDLTVERFLRALAWNCAGIRLGPLGYLDLASGGRNRFSGRGFRRRFDDGTDGQVRHFAGMAVAPVLLGERAARWSSIHVLGDAPGSADGQLSEAALTFSRELRTGRLAPSDAGDWIRHHLAS
ncbi:hypothetical protein [Herbiconiux sp. L3-i23]|uniref:hypothetical protein n=1 Tax=Herbiconiux sp. L3-i23 TaxID=2905871 RepID=UPI002073AEAA|nr:hypothetical protein [Herbiconiux sp. L3-i23]